MSVVRAHALTNARRPIIIQKEHFANTVSARLCRDLKNASAGLFPADKECILENNKNDDVIRLGDIFRVLWKNIILIAVITAVIFVCGIVYTFAIAKPQYSAVQSFVVATRDTGTGNITSGTPSTTVINTVSGLVTENNVLAPVAQANDLTAGQLKDMITVSSATNNGIIRVTVESGSAELSVKLANELFDSLETFLRETSIQVYYGCAVVESSPATNGVYTSPNKVLYLAIFLLGGIVVGCIAVYVKEFCSTKFKSKSEVENYLGEKVVGIFVDDTEKGKKSREREGERRHVELVKPSIRNYEPYNKLFTNIKYSNVDNPYRIIMITSSQERELKSSTLGNFACCMAFNKQKVVVIDMDMRKPIMHKLFRVPKDNGIIEYVDGTCGREDIIKHSEYGVDVITAGKKVINPVVIIESVGFRKLLAELLDNYDYVLVDTPPALACSDACSIAKLCDGVIFNVAMSDVKKKKAAAALQSLTGVGAHIIGINITKAVATKQDDYYYDDKYYISVDASSEEEDGAKES